MSEASTLGDVLGRAIARDESHDSGEFPRAPARLDVAGPTLSDDKIDHMVRRFLAWPLPDDFGPDGGITFERFRRGGNGHPFRNEPVGTNLLTFTQAEAMVRHMLGDIPMASAVESAWLIEFGDSPVSAPHYWPVDQDATTWTADNAEAMRFARKVDAEAFARAYIEAEGQRVRICEHQWSDA